MPGHAFRSMPSHSVSPFKVLLGLINLGSAKAFNAFVNSAAVTLYISYVCRTPGLHVPTQANNTQIAPVILGVMKRMRGEPINYGPFQLGRWRNLLNITTIVYTVFTCFFLFWPTVPNSDASTMNWSILLVGGIMVISMVWWFIAGKNEFVAPNLDTVGPVHLA